MLNSHTCNGVGLEVLQQPKISLPVRPRSLFPVTYRFKSGRSICEAVPSDCQPEGIRGAAVAPRPGCTFGKLPLESGLGVRGNSTVAQSGSSSTPIRASKSLKRQYASDVGVEEQQSG
jgi:hypothetical protein